MKTPTYTYLSTAGAPRGINDPDKMDEADTSLFPPNFAENITDFHTRKDEGHLYHAELANLAATARSIFHQVGATEVRRSQSRCSQQFVEGVGGTKMSAIGIAIDRKMSRYRSIGRG